MNRETLVEKAAHALYCDYRQNHPGLLTWETEPDYFKNERFRSPASVVVDALLPQVTTVEELEALPERSAVVFDPGQISLLLRVENGRLRGDSWVGSFAQAIAELGPLTVVWSPS